MLELGSNACSDYKLPQGIPTSVWFLCLKGSIFLTHKQFNYNVVNCPKWDSNLEPSLFLMSCIFERLSALSYELDMMIITLISCLMGLVRFMGLDGG